MLHKQFIFHVTVKGLLRIYTVVQKQSTSVAKVGVTHAYQAFIKVLGFKFQCRCKCGLIVQQKVNKLEIHKNFKRK